MEIFFCDRCGRRITEAEIERQEAAVIETEVYCKVCLRADAQLQARFDAAKAAAERKHKTGITTREKTSLVSLPEQGMRTSTRRFARVAPEDREAKAAPVTAVPRGGNTAMFVAAGALLILGLLGLGYIVLGGRHEAPAPKPPGPPATAPVTAKPAPERPAVPVPAPPPTPPKPPVPEKPGVIASIRSDTFEIGSTAKVDGWYKTFGRYEGLYVIGCDGAGSVELEMNERSGDIAPSVGLACRASLPTSLTVQVDSQGGTAQGTLNIPPGGWSGCVLESKDFTGPVSGRITKVRISGNVPVANNVMIDVFRVAIGYKEGYLAEQYAIMREIEDPFSGVVTLGNRGPFPGRIYWGTTFDDQAGMTQMKTGSLERGGFAGTQAARMELKDNTLEILLRGGPFLGIVPRNALWAAMVKAPTTGTVSFLVEVCDRIGTEHYHMAKTDVAVKEGWQAVLVPFSEMEMRWESTTAKAPRLPAEVLVRGVHVKWNLEVVPDVKDVLVDDVIAASDVRPETLSAWLSSAKEATAAMLPAPQPPKPAPQPAPPQPALPPAVLTSQPQGTILWCGFEPDEAFPKTLVDGLKPVPDGYPGTAQGLNVNDTTNNVYRVSIRRTREPSQSDVAVCTMGPDAVLVFAARSRERKTIYVEAEGARSKRFVTRYNITRPLGPEWELFALRIRDMGYNEPASRYPSDGAPLAWLDFRSDSGPFEIDSVAIYPDGTPDERKAELKRWIDAKMRPAAPPYTGFSLVEYKGTNARPTIEPAGSANSFQPGALQALDRPNLWKSVPASLKGAARLLTARNDRNDNSSDAYALKFDVAMTVYAVLDPRYTPATLPAWVAAQGWQETGLTAASDADMGGATDWKIYKLEVQPGTYRFGTDTPDNRDGITYVFVPKEPLPAAPIAAPAPAPGAALKPGKYQAAGKEVEVIAADDLSSGQSMFAGGEVKAEAGGVAAPGGGLMLAARQTTTAHIYGFSLIWKNKGETLVRAGNNSFAAFDYYFDGPGGITLNAFNATRQMTERFEMSAVKKKEWRVAIAELRSFEPSSGDRSKRIQAGDNITEFKILAGLKEQGGVFCIRNFMIINGDRDAVTAFAESMRSADTGAPTPPSAGQQAAKPVELAMPAVLRHFYFTGGGAAIAVRSSKAAAKFGLLTGRSGILIEQPQETDAKSAARIEIPLPEPSDIAQAGGAALALSGKDAAGCVCRLGVIVNNDSENVAEITRSPIAIVDDSPRLYWAPLNTAVTSGRGPIDKLVLYFNSSPSPKQNPFSMLVEGIAFTGINVERVLDFEGTGDLYKGISGVTDGAVTVSSSEACSGNRSLMFDMQFSGGSRPSFRIDLTQPLVTKGVKSIYLSLRLEANRAANVSFQPVSGGGLWDIFMREDGSDYIEIQPGKWHQLRLTPRGKALSDLNTRPSPQQIQVMVWQPDGKARLWIDDFFVER